MTVVTLYIVNAQLVNFRMFDVPGETPSLVARLIQCRQNRNHIEDVVSAVDAMIEQNGDEIRTMINQANIRDATGGIKLYIEVKRDLFNDGGINCGRVIALIAFIMLLAEHFKTLHLHPDRAYVLLFRAFDCDLKDWLDANGGWSVFCDYKRSTREFSFKLFTCMLVGVVLFKLFFQ